MFIMGKNLAKQGKKLWQTRKKKDTHIKKVERQKEKIHIFGNR